MKLSLEMQHKLAYMAGGLHLRNREEPKERSPIYLTGLQIRSENVSGGGAVPEDELQIDFCISTGDRDSFFSYMTEKTLRNYAEGAQRGTPFMLDHSSGVRNQIGRSVAASYDESEKRVTATISMLRDTESTPEAMRVDEYIRRIERRYYTDCSVGFKGGREVCRLDGKDIWDYRATDPCPHIPGQTYDGKVCEYDVDDAELREVSLVANGSNPEAKLLDTRNMPTELQAIKKGESEPDAEKTLLERDGLKWREQLIDAALKEGVRAEDDFDQEAWKARLEKDDSERILVQTETWRKLGDTRWGEGGRKTDGGHTPESGNQEVLILPSVLFSSNY